MGYPQINVKKIFEPFYTLKKRQEQVLDFRSAKKIITAHGGDIIVGDAEHGAVFTVVLPKKGITCLEKYYLLMMKSILLLITPNCSLSRGLRLSQPTTVKAG